MNVRTRDALFLTCIVFASLVLFVDGSGVNEEAQALSDLYTYTKGTNWKSNCVAGGWGSINVSLNPCSQSFYPYSLLSGIVCNAPLGNVIYINKAQCSLNGVLPPTFLSSLPVLQTLVLNTNQLSGPLPSMADSTQHLSLTSMKLGGTSLNGTLPDALGDWFPALQELTLDNCPKVGGTLPLLWYKMTQLATLDLSMTGVTGTLPSEWGGLKNLTSVKISNAALLGTLPSWWGLLNRLQTLSLSTNKLNGTLPASWSSMSSLTTISLASNLLEGSLPGSWSSLTRLVTVDLKGNMFTGTLPAEYSQWVNLSTFTLSAAYLTTKPTITGTLPAEWGQLTSLKNLELDELKLNGTLPSEWGGMWNMTSLRIFRSPLTGTLPPSWSNMTKLYELGLGQAQLTGVLPEEWGTSMTALSFAYLYANQFVGTLPASWSAMRRLSTLNLYGNQLAGTLPAAWSVISSLRGLYLDRNNLVGTIPDAWCNLTSLAALSLNENRLEGTLPQGFANITWMQNLFLYNNRFTGTLPEAWGASWSSMSSLQLQNNQLTGTLPVSWSRLSSLQNLDLSMNNLDGTVPKEWPEGMVAIASSGMYAAPCRVSCFGWIGVGATCRSFSSNACVSVRLWYNMLSLHPNVPPLNSSNRWNWRGTNFYFGPQRRSATVSWSISLPPRNVPGTTPTDSVSASSLPTASVSFSGAPSAMTFSTSFSASRSVVPTPSRGARSPSLTLVPTLTAEIVSQSPTIAPSSTTTPQIVVQAVSVDPPIAPETVGASASSGGIGAIGSLAGVDPGGAAVQAMLTFLACQNHEPTRSATFASWLGLLPISPFMLLGLMWAVLGNMILTVVVALLHTLAVATHALWKKSSFVESAEILRFPALSIAFGEWLLTGIAVCSASLTIGVAGSSSGSLALGWMGIVFVVACLGLWYFGTGPAVSRCRYEPWAPLAPLCPSLLSLLKSPGVWEPKQERSRWGTLYDSMRMRCAHWRWVCIAATCLVAALTGAGGVRGGGCEAALAISAALLLLIGLAIVVVRPHRNPSENVLNSLKFALLGLTCIFQVALHPSSSDSQTALALLAIGQSIVTALRLLIKLYLRAELRNDNTNRKNKEDAASSGATQQLSYFALDDSPLLTGQMPLQRETIAEGKHNNQMAEDDELCSVDLDDDDGRAKECDLALPDASAAVAVRPLPPQDQDIIHEDDDGGDGTNRSEGTSKAARDEESIVGVVHVAMFVPAFATEQPHDAHLNDDDDPLAFTSVLTARKGPQEKSSVDDPFSVLNS